MQQPEISIHPLIGRLLSEDIECKYIGNKLSEKYSAADKVRKKYNFHYFEITNLTFENDKKGRFRSNGKNIVGKH